MAGQPLAAGTEIASKGLEQFASAGIDFTLSVMFLAVLSASLTQSVYDLFLRRMLHAMTVRAWVKARGGDWASWREGTRNGRLYVLHYQRLCGQLSAFLQFELESPSQWLLLPNMATKASLDRLRGAGTEDERIQARQQVSAETEEALDDLQNLLGNRTVIITYMLCILFSFAIITLLTVTRNQFVDVQSATTSLYFMGLVAGLMGPIFRNLIERLLTPH